LFELLNAMLCAVFNLMNSILKQHVAFTTFTLFVMDSTQKHGMSLLTLYRRSAMLPGPCLLVFFFPAEAESSFNMVSDVLNLFQEPLSLTQILVCLLFVATRPYKQSDN
jgi:hypothetical protein